MEQGLTFVAVVGLCMVGVVMNSPLFTLSAFVIGSLYLLVRGKKKGWKWPKRP